MIFSRCLEPSVLISKPEDPVANSLSFAFIATEPYPRPAENMRVLPSGVSITLRYGDDDDALVDSLDEAMAISVTAGEGWHYEPFVQDAFNQNQAVATLLYTGPWSFDDVKNLAFKLKNIRSFCAAGRASIEVTLHRILPDDDATWLFDVERCAVLPLAHLQFHPDFNQRNGASNAPGKAVTLFHKVLGCKKLPEKVTITRDPPGPVPAPKTDSIAILVDECQTEYRLTMEDYAQLSASLFVYPAEPEAEFIDDVDEKGSRVLRCNVQYAEPERTLVTQRPVVGPITDMLASSYVIPLSNDSHNFAAVFCSNSLGVLLQTVWRPPVKPVAGQNLFAWTRTVRQRHGMYFVRLEWVISAGMENVHGMYFLNPQLRKEMVSFIGSQNTSDDLLWFNAGHFGKKQIDKNYPDRENWCWEYAFPAESVGYFQGIACYDNKKAGSPLRLLMPDVYCGTPEWYFRTANQENV